MKTLTDIIVSLDKILVDSSNKFVIIVKIIKNSIIPFRSLFEVIKEIKNFKLRHSNDFQKELFHGLKTIENYVETSHDNF